MKNKFIKSTFILLVGGFLTKVFGMIIRITTNRVLGSEATGVYMLIMPTFSLLLSISQFSFPTTISKLVSEEKRNNRDLLFSIIPISILINIVLMLIVYFLAPFISINLLHNKNTLLALKYMGLALPFISISSIIRGYFFGKEKMFVHVFSNLFEDIIRYLTIILFLPKFKSVSIAVFFLVISNIFSELASIFIFSIFMPKNINLRDLKYNNSYVKDIFNLSIPTTFSRLIGNIGYFFEPIIISFILGNVTKEYGALNGYVIPILFLPSFFTTAISQALIPVISNSYVNKRYKYMKSKLKLALFISLMIGIIFTIIFYMYPKELLLLLYKTDSGYKYLKFMSLFFLFYYIELPVSFALGAMGFARETLRCTIYSVFLKNILLIIFCYIYKFDGVMLAICFNILFQTFYNLYILKAKVNYLR